MVEEVTLAPRGGMQNRDGVNDLSVFDYIKSFWKKRWRIIWSSVASGVLGVVVSLVLPNQYSSQVTALIPKSPGGGVQVGQFAELASLAGVSLGASAGGSSEEILAILTSNRLIDDVIERYNLKEYYGKDGIEGAEKSFRKDFIAKNDLKTGRIIFGYTHTDPNISAGVSNYCSELLREIYNEIHQNEADRELNRLEGRMARAAEELDIAQRQLASFQGENNAFQIESQALSVMQEISQLQGRLIGQQVELQTLLGSGMSSENPEAIIIEQRIAELRKIITKMVAGVNENETGSLIGLKKLPKLGMEYSNVVRAVKTKEVLYAAMVARAESARLALGNYSSVITIIDNARVPEGKSGPPRVVICLSAFLLGGLLAVLYTYSREFWIPMMNKEA